MIELKLELNKVIQGFFNLYVEGKKAGEMSVNIDSINMMVYHTEAFPKYENRGYAKQLLDAMVAYTRGHHLLVNPLCPYIYAQFHRHPAMYADIWSVSHYLNF